MLPNLAKRTKKDRLPKELFERVETVRLDKKYYTATQRANRLRDLDAMIRRQRKEIERSTATIGKYHAEKARIGKLPAPKPKAKAKRPAAYLGATKISPRQ